MTIKTTIRFLLYLVLIGLTLPFLLGYLNMIHPLFDSFSHFRVHLLLGILPLLLLIAFFHEKLIAFIYLLVVGLGAFYLYSITQPFKLESVDHNKTHLLKHLQFNLSFRNRRMEDFKSYLKEHKPDVVTLQEVTPAHQKALKELMGSPFAFDFSTSFPYISKERGEYPYQIYCNFQAVGGVAILSKYPFNKEKSICMEGQGLVRTQISVNHKAINIVSIHTYWPYPYDQPKQIETIKKIFYHIKPPTLIAGDFNAVAWSHSVKEIEKASHTKVVNGLRWTLSLEGQVPFIPNFKLPIDQVLVSKELEVRKIFVEKSLGSDHFPVVSEIWF